MKIYDYNGKKNIGGDRLREARVVRRLRQEDLAAQIQLKGINMERDSISRIEIGTRFVSDFELKIFAEVLGVSVQWLLGIDEWRRRGDPVAAYFFLLFSQKLLTYTHVYSIIIDRKEVKTLSKKKQKKSGNKKDQPASTINLITAIVNLVIAILLLIEKLTR